MNYNYENKMNENGFLEIATKSWYYNYFQFVKDNIDKWNWDSLSANPNITFVNIMDTIDDPRFRWKWDGLSANPNITFVNIMDNQ